MITRTVIRGLSTSARLMQTETVASKANVQMAEVEKLLNKIKQLSVDQMKPSAVGAKSFKKKPTNHANGKAVAGQRVKFNKSIGDEFKNLSDNFGAEQTPIIRSATARGNNNNNNRARLSSKSRRHIPRSNDASQSTAGKSGKARTTKARSTETRTTRTTARTPKVNPNLTVITTDYHPEIPTLESLLIQSPIAPLSNTADSKIIKLFKSLLKNGDLNIDAALRADIKTTSLDLTQFKQNAALKGNAEVVLSALNKNNSIDFETKLKLVKPLTGLESVKSLA